MNFRFPGSSTRHNFYVICIRCGVQCFIMKTSHMTILFYLLQYKCGICENVFDEMNHEKKLEGYQDILRDEDTYTENDIDLDDYESRNGYVFVPYDENENADITSKFSILCVCFLSNL